MTIEVHTDVTELANVGVNTLSADTNVEVNSETAVVTMIGTNPILGPKGEPGRGIVNIQKTSTAGLVDTYTINYTDNTSSNYQVVNGEKGDTGESGVEVSETEPTNPDIKVWLNPDGEATQVGSALSINGRSLSLLSDEAEVMSTITLPEYQPIGDYATNTALVNGLAQKQNTISDLTTIRSNAANGQTAYTTIQGFGDIVTYNASSFATSAQGAKADSALQSINSTMVVNALGFTPYNATNPSGYITQSAINTHNVDTTAHDDIRDIAEEALSRAGQAVQSLVFDTTEDMEEYISDVAHKDELKVGDNLYIKDVSVDDYWVSAVLETPDAQTGYYYEISPLSGEKPSIANMVTTDTAQTISGDKNFTGALKLNNYDVATQSFVTGQGYITGITSSDVTTALGYTPYNETNPNNYISGNTAITGATHTKITYDSKGLVIDGTDLTESDIPNLALSKITDVTATATELNVLDGITASTTELNYSDGVTSNIQTQLDGKLKNLATGSNSIALSNATTSTYSVQMGNTATVGSSSTAIGYYARSSSTYGTAIGRNSYVSGNYGTSVGYSSQATTDAVGIGYNAKATGSYAIQLGYGTNSNATTMYVGFGSGKNYKLLDGTTGKIPVERLPVWDGSVV